MASRRPEERDSFPSTNWSLVGHAGRAESQALGELLQRYRPALKAHLVHKKKLDPHRADDLLQSFILTKVLERDLIARADPEKGKFRSFLLTALNRYLIDVWRSERPRGGNTPPINVDSELLQDEVADAPPADVFDVAWALQALVESFRRMQAKCWAKGRQDLWGVFEGRVLAPLLGTEPLPFRLLAERLGLESEQKAANRYATALHTFRRNLLEVIGEYAGEAEAEIQDLQSILGRAGPELVEALRSELWARIPELPVSAPNLQLVEPSQLAHVLGAGQQPSDPAALLRHVLTSPLPFDPSGLNPELTRRLAAWAGGPGCQLNSLAELLQHPRPPVELLELVKQFTKDNHNDPESPLPREVATVLYYASLAAALVHCGRRITTHDDGALRQGFQWAYVQPGVDKALRELFQQGLQLLG